MGTASSVSCNIIYLSNISQNEYINQLHNKLEQLGRKIVLRESNNISEYSIHQSEYIIICISPNTIRSIQQITEINHAWDSQKPIIYIMTDKSYTPLCNPELNSVVKKHTWLSCVDEKSMNESFTHISQYINSNDKMNLL